MSEASNMTMRVAVFRNMRHQFTTVLNNHSKDDDWTLEEYVRVSEWVTVEFKPLTQAEIAGTELTSLSKLRAQTVAEFSEKLGQIDERMANLRALTGPVSP